MEFVFADLHTERGFAVDVEYKIRLKLVLNPVADNDPILLDVASLKRTQECLAS